MYPNGTPKEYMQAFNWIDYLSTPLSKCRLLYDLLGTDAKTVKNMKNMKKALKHNSHKNWYNHIKTNQDDLHDILWDTL